MAHGPTSFLELRLYLDNLIWLLLLKSLIWLIGKALRFAYLQVGHSSAFADIFWYIQWFAFWNVLIFSYISRYLKNVYTSTANAIATVQGDVSNPTKSSGVRNIWISAMRSYVIHHMAIKRKCSTYQLSEHVWDLIHVKFRPHLSGANELTHNDGKLRNSFNWQHMEKSGCCNIFRTNIPEE